VYPEKTVISPSRVVSQRREVPQAEQRGQCRRGDIDQAVRRSGQGQEQLQAWMGQDGFYGHWLHVVDVKGSGDDAGIGHGFEIDATCQNRNDLSISRWTATNFSRGLKPG
jgi:hypothetical protein